MRKNNLEAWTYTSSLNCLLFFAQRMDELLFHHTTDSYRYSALSIRGISRGQVLESWDKSSVKRV